MNSAAVILAFGFANLVALGWLAAAAAPILIHLWMRQTRRETHWAAIRFLQAALERQARKLRLQHWILLAVRTLLLLLVALAAAKPFFDSGPLAGVSTPTHWVMVVDASLSMTYQHEGATRIEAAKRLAADLVNESGSSDRYSLCVMGAKATTPIAGSTADRSAVLRAIDRIEPTHGTASLDNALSQVDRIVASSAEGLAAGLRIEVLFFTDLGDNTWASVAGSEGSSNLLSKLKENSNLSVVDVGLSDASNVAVTQIELANSLPTVANPIEIRGEILSNSPESDQTRDVELMVDGLQVAKQSVRLSSTGPTPIDFLHKFTDAGSHAIRLRIADDPLMADNSAWLAMDLAPRIRVLCVEGARGAARYVADSLNPSGDSDSSFEPVVISDADLTTVKLSDFRCIIFCNVMGFGPSEMKRIESYVRQGGGAVFFLGNRTSPESYNELFSGQHGGRLGVNDSLRSPFRFVSNDSPTEGQLAENRLAPIRVEKPAARTSYGLDPLDYAHPIVGRFRGQERSGLLTTPVARSHTLRLLTEDPTAAQVVLSHEGGLPFLIASSYGLGNLLVVATDASLDSIDPTTGQPWTAMPAWPSFLPLMRGMVEHVGAGGAPQRLQVGQPFQGQLATEDWGEQDISIERPDDQSETVSVSSDGHWTYGRTDRIGLYRAMQSNGKLYSAAAANADPVESSMRRVALDTLPDWLTVQQGEASSTASGGLGSQASIHRLLIQLALLLALLDTALASWFGRGHA